jgi:hypothetical protein
MCVEASNGLILQREPSRRSSARRRLAGTILARLAGA